MIFQIHLGKMSSHQRQWWELENFIPLLVGGYGSGKTYIGALKSIWLSYLNSSLPGQYVSPSYNMARKTIIPTLEEILLRSGLDYDFNQTRHEFRIFNWDGVIWIASGDDPDSLRGPNLAWAGIDEPFIQSQRVFEQMEFRVRHPEATLSCLFLTGTPEELNWGYSLAMNDQDKWDVGVVYGRTRDNFALPPERVAAWEAAFDEDQRKAYLEGQFLNLLHGRVYKPFDRAKHLVAQPSQKSPPTVIAGIDFNVDYMTAEIAYRGPTWIHWFDEIRLPNANTYDLAAELKARHPGIRVYPDPTGSARKSSATQSDHEILRQAGFSVYARGQVPVRDRINAVNRLLRESWMTIEPGACPHLITDLERNTWRSGDIDKLTDPAMTHAGDAAGYPIEFLFPVVSKEIRYYRR